MLSRYPLEEVQRVPEEGDFCDVWAPYPSVMSRHQNDDYNVIYRNERGFLLGVLL
jgi:hypothetical protein